MPQQLPEKTYLDGVRESVDEIDSFVSRLLLDAHSTEAKAICRTVLDEIERRFGQWHCAESEGLTIRTALEDARDEVYRRTAPVIKTLLQHLPDAWHKKTWSSLLPSEQRMVKAIRENAEAFLRGGKEEAERANVKLTDGGRNE